MYNQSRKRVDNMNQLPCSEYPRPQMKRESYLCLNGEWNFSIYGEKRNENGKVMVTGSFDVNVWYAYDNDTKTKVNTKQSC